MRDPFAYDEEEAREFGLPTEDRPEFHAETGTDADGKPWRSETLEYFRECPRCGWFTLAVREESSTWSSSHHERCVQCDYLGYTRIGGPPGL